MPINAKEPAKAPVEKVPGGHTNRPVKKPVVNVPVKQPNS